MKLRVYCRSFYVTRRKKKLARGDMRAVLLPWKKSEVSMPTASHADSEG